jgi:L-ascorbate metabolism protein UlaG (beta-lactamase superfamily)
MKLLKADNYQTWFIEEAGQGVLIDPWLSKQLQPDSSIFIQRKRNQASLLSDEDYKKVQAIIITAPFDSACK